MSSLPAPAGVEPIPLADALSRRYLAYALSTITARSLPDVRDGLKPVQRRVLYAMLKLRLDPDAGYKKCARVVGDVIGKYHPHGEVAIYDAMVRLAQEFAQRYPLVDGQGNFGNVDGDNAAAMRYTEARLTAVARALLDGIDQDTVDFRPTYDGSDEEPVVLPAAFPNLLANGSSGIAVGMATSVPPHNAGELCQALCQLLDDPDASSEALLAHIKGPDLPTGGVLVEPLANLRETYRTGRGSFRLRARWQREDLGHGQYQVVVTEMPYQVPKARLIERIAELLALRKLPLLADVRDEFRRGGAARAGAARAHRAGRGADGAAVPPDRPRGPPAAQPERPGRRGRAPGHEPRPGAGGVPRASHGGADPALALPARQDRRPPGGARRLPDRLSQPRRGDPDHPRGGRAQGRADAHVRAVGGPGRGDLEHAPAQPAPARGADARQGGAAAQGRAARARAVAEGRKPAARPAEGGDRGGAPEVWRWPAGRAADHARRAAGDRRPGARGAGRASAGDRGLLAPGLAARAARPSRGRRRAQVQGRRRRALRAQGRDHRQAFADQQRRSRLSAAGRAPAGRPRPGRAAPGAHRARARRRAAQARRPSPGRQASPGVERSARVHRRGAGDRRPDPDRQAGVQSRRRRAPGGRGYRPRAITSRPSAATASFWFFRSTSCR